ncbi:MAG: GYD domain-containing protein, partial [Deltaproteobacteria bacterium]|nr:GYD domain-containing protein [Deltaproteobacteria bacterium]
DVITIIEMPDEKVAAATILKICSKGRITSRTMTALSIDDFLKIAKEV